MLNNVELTKTLIPYAIHGNNAEMIHILESNVDEIQEEEEWNGISKDSIQFHNNDISSYIKENMKTKLF